MDTKKVVVNLIYWGMIIVVIFTCIYLVVYLRSSSRECLADPLQFYEEKSGIHCYCSNGVFGNSVNNNNPISLNFTLSE